MIRLGRKRSRKIRDGFLKLAAPPVEKSGLPDLERVGGELKLLEERYSMDPLEELLGSEIYER